MNYRLNLRVLRAFAKHVAPKKESRPYLVGVALEFEEDGIYYVATDGTVLAAARLPYDNFDAAPDKPVRVILPREFVLGLKATRHVSAATLTAEPWALDGAPFTPVDGNYPEWRRILPKNNYTSGEQVAHFNAVQLAALDACAHDAFDCLSPNYVFNAGYGTAAVVNVKAPAFLGLIVPLTFKKPPPVPSWAGIAVPGAEVSGVNDLV